MVLSKDLEQRIVMTIRLLSADAVEKAKSGHPGLPMGMADAAFTLWSRYLKHCPSQPAWPDRDRFVLSAGHGSMLLYSLLFLFGYGLRLEDLKNFRQWESPTPGHPEYGAAPGIETTTGPLGQGLGNAVGMALAERMLAARFNTEKFPIFNHRTYVLASDGDMMEGVASEAASLAGHLGVGSLIVLYDDNHITIEGNTDLAFSEDVGARFAAYGWHVQAVDGHDRPRVGEAIAAAQKKNDRPNLIVCRTHIAYGAPTKQDTAAAHGEPLGEAEIRAIKEREGFPPDQTFYVPPEVSAYMGEIAHAGERAYAAWCAMLDAYRREEPARAADLDRCLAGDLPADLENSLPAFEPGKMIATRVSAGTVLNALAKAVPSLVGGSADLAPSTKTIISGGGDIARGKFAGRNFHFGIREHGMGAAMNGIALHGGFIPYGATFLVFADYMRPPIRLAALMKLRTIYVFTHDSIFVGEDGPTHQPVEQMASLRAIPNLDVLRPAEATEAAYAWLHALQRNDGPTALCLSRQNLPTFDRARFSPARGVLRGAYVLNEDPAPWDWILIGSGSEVHVCVEAAESLRAEGARVRVVSMPCWELFLRQDAAYREALLPDSSRKAVVEAGVRQGWDRFVGHNGVYVTMDRFGASAPAKSLAEKFGFTAKEVLRVLNEA
jgi:transketolase